jgi:hypothetical protein
MYFTDPGDDAIGRASLSGEVTEYPVPSSSATTFPTEIAVLGDQLVFAENGPAVGIIDPSGLPNAAPLTTPPSLDAVEASLRAQLTVAAPSSAVALQHGRRSFTLTLQALETGTVTVEWLAETSDSGSSTSPIVVASCEGAFDLSGSTQAQARVTPAGQRLLKSDNVRSRRLRLTVRATFAGRVGAEVTALLRVKPKGKRLRRGSSRKRDPLDT